MPLPKMRGMRGGQGLKGTVGQASVQQPTQGKLRTANAAKRNTTSGRSLGPGLLPHAVDTDVVIRQRANVPHPTQASEYIGLQIQAPSWQTSAPTTSLPPALHRLLQSDAAVHLPPVHSMRGKRLDNRELDKLLAGLGRSETTWRRALLVHGWLQDIGHQPDDRLCTTLIRLCSTHGDAQQALALYDWMQVPIELGGGGLSPTVYTYTAAMRAALSGNLCSKAFQIWDDAAQTGCQPDCRMCTVYIEICTRAGQPERALAMYRQMAAAQAGSRLAASVHTYTAALRAAAADEACCPQAMSIWEDMLQAGCQPTGHAFAAAISACGAAGRWEQAASLFSQMLDFDICPDVVSCTAFASALAAGGQWQHCEGVLQWMQKEGVQPNVRTYTALLVAFGSAGEWDRLADMLQRMQQDHWLRAEPNAYTYASLIKVMSEHGRLDMAEQLFTQLYPDVVAAMQLLHSHQALPSSIGSQDATLSPLASHSLWGSLADAPAASGLWQPSAPQQAGSAVGSSPLQTSASQQSLTEHLESFNMYDALPTSVAESVLVSRRSWELAVMRLPDGLPGQAGLSGPRSGHSDASSDMSFPAARLALASEQHGARAASGASLAISPKLVINRHQALSSTLAQPMCSTIITTAMMSAYERCHSWREVIHVLQQTRHLGVPITTAQANAAIMALGKLGDVEGAGQLFCSVSEPDAGTYCSITVACGLAGLPSQCEDYLAACHAAGFSAHQSCFCSLIAAYCMSGQWQAGLAVRERLGAKRLSVHVFNALLIASQLGGQATSAASVRQDLQDLQLVPNEMTGELLEMAKIRVQIRDPVARLQAVVIASTGAHVGTL